MPEAGHDEDRRFGLVEWALFLAVGSIWGASFLFIDIGLESLEPGLITLIRVGLGAMTLALMNRQFPKIERGDWPKMVLLGVTWVAIPFTLFPIAEQHVSSAVAGMLNGATPLFATICLVLLFGGKVNLAQKLGVLAGFVGVSAVALAQGGVGDSAWFGIALVVFATVLYGYSVNVAAPLQRKYGSMAVMGAMLGVATIFDVPFGLLSLRGSSFELGPVLAVTVLGVCGTGLAFALMGELITRVGPTRASFITYVTPLVAAALGIVLRNDEVRPIAVFGVAMVVAGAYLASRQATE